MSKEHAYAYEAGYRDGSIHYELEHYPSCKNVADLQEALAENAKLRELMCDMYRSMDVSCQFGHAIPAGTMAHIKNRVIGLGVEVNDG